MPDFSKKGSFSVELPPALSDYYDDKEQELGSGGFAHVILAEHRATRQKVAIKIMDKQRLAKKDDLHRAYCEIYALKALLHQHICQLFQVYEDGQFIYLVLEYCPGGELFEYIVAKKRLQEKEARILFRQIISAVAFIHENGYAHRDLKPENMLLDEKMSIKLIDFGLSAKPEHGLSMPLRTRAGSALYASPELIAGQPYYGTRTDVWSLGVVLFALLCGFLPFDHEDTMELYKKIKKGEFSVPQWLSQGSVVLLRSMLTVRPSRRITVGAIIQHPWMLQDNFPPVNPASTLKREQLNPVAVGVVAEENGWSYEHAASRILKYDYDHITAHYLILSRMSVEDISKLQKPGHYRTSSTESFDGGLHAGGMNGLLSEKSPKRKPRSQTVFDYDTPTPMPRHFLQPPLLVPAVQRLRDEEDVVYKKNVIHGSYGTGLDVVAISGPSMKSQPQKSASLEDHYEVERKPRSKSTLVAEVTHRIAGLFKVDSSPRRVKAIYNVENTSTLPPDRIHRELERVVMAMVDEKLLLSYSSDRFLLKCKSYGEHNRAVFELEVCSIPFMDGVFGIRRKRLKGDAWKYKSLVEMILARAKV